MYKILVLLFAFFLIVPSASAKTDKDCSEFNKITNWKGWKKCMKGEEANVKKNKSGNIISDIGNKYKDIREKTPKTGIELWKKLPRKNEN